MRPRWKIWVGLAIGAVVCVYFVAHRVDSAQTALEETRRELRRQGFKIDLSEFNFTTSAEMRARAAALATAGPLRNGFRPIDMQLMTGVGSNSAVVFWRDGRPESYMGDDLWPQLRDYLNDNQAALDAACDAALGGPIRFDLTASAGSAMLLPHLATLRALTDALGVRAMLDLRDGDKDAAWTNLLAETALVTSWDPEPAEPSHRVRGVCVTSAYNTTWQMLQAGGWSDARLADLQRAWESADFFKGLPETAAFARASGAAAFQMERRQPPGSGLPLTEMIRAPQWALRAFASYWQRLQYLRHGSYEDERNLLLFHRDRELQLRAAIQVPTWSEMCQLPAVTNVMPFQSRYQSRSPVLMRMNMMQTAMRFQSPRQGLPGQAAEAESRRDKRHPPEAVWGKGLPGQAAEAESRRRLVVTAIALERYRGRHGSYPKSLPELAPELLKSPPIDFMDGQPLRYRLTDDGHFLLYSVGLDCVDDGGKMPVLRRQGAPYANFRPGQREMGTDLVWPLPASPAAVADQGKEEEQAAARRQAELDKRMEEAESALETEHRAAVEKLLAEKPAPRLKEPLYQGRPLSEALRNGPGSGHTNLSLDEMLTVKQIHTTNDPETATFEVPVSYEAASKIGRLHLVVDGESEDPFDQGEFQECQRADNGNCLLLWKTTYDPSGRHAAQAELLLNPQRGQTAEAAVQGPAAPFFSSNLCQFSHRYDTYNARGATLYARLPESNGVYAIELKDPAGKHIITLQGTTSNGVINVHWNLVDDRGRAYANQSFDSVFTVTLPDSGRTQTMKGP